MKRFRALKAASLPVLVAAGLWAQTPAEVVVIVNQASPLSVQIGSYYRQKRGIPPGNICAIRTAASEAIARGVYDREVAAPIGQCLQSRGLVEKVLYLVTTAGVPLRITGATGQTGDYASVDSELTLLYQDLNENKPHRLDGPLRNPFFGQRDAPFRHPDFPIYLVTRLAAYDFEGVKAIIDRGLAARNTGKFVIDLDSAGDHTGNDWLRNAALLLPGNRVVMDESTNVLLGLKDVIAYAGWGSNDKARKARFLGFQWLPGAIVTEYVSTNGRTFQRPPANWTIGAWSKPETWWVGAPQTLTADYLLEGATGASGHVDEPFLSLTPRPDFLLPAWFAGRNLADAYWLSIPAVSWQNIVVGDPLCRLAK